MGEFKFRLPKQWAFTRRQASQIHTVGLDGIPWPCKVSVSDGILTVARNRNESGRTYIAFPFENYGELTVATGTLPERSEPYFLTTELARGTLNRLRNQLSIWQEGGLEIDDSIFQTADSATASLRRSLFCDDENQQDQHARQSLEMALEAAFSLSSTFGTQVTKFRQNNPNAQPFWLAETISPHCNFANGYLTEGFDLIRMAPELTKQATQIQLDRRIIAGPFLDASVGGLGETLERMEDFEVRKNYLVNYCRDYFSNMPPNISLLHVVSGLNGMGHRHLSYPQQLEMTFQLLEVAAEVTQDVPTMVSFDFPWAERLASAVGGSHPLQIADSLLRQRANISFLGIEVNLGYWPGGSVMRDPLQWIDMLDMWAQLGLPLVILLRAPTWGCAGEQHGVPVTAPAFDPSNSKEQNQDDRLVNQFESESDQLRLQYLDTVLQMLVARPSVHGLIWAQGIDGDDFRFPFGGLQLADGRQKQVSQQLTQLAR